MLKALKEAKVHTSWITPNTEYEDAVLQFVRAILDPAREQPFLDDFAQLQKQGGVLRHVQLAVADGAEARLARRGRHLPGQRAVGLLAGRSGQPPAGRLSRCARSICAGCSSARDDRLQARARRCSSTREDGRIKLYISQRLLCLRRERPELFVGGSYTPLRGNQHVAAFARAADGQTLVIAAPVQIATLTRGALVAARSAPRCGARSCCPCPASRAAPTATCSRASELTARRARTAEPPLKLAEVFARLSRRRAAEP